MDRPSCAKHFRKTQQKRALSVGAIIAHFVLDISKWGPRACPSGGKRTWHSKGHFEVVDHEAVRTCRYLRSLAVGEATSTAVGGAGRGTNGLEAESGAKLNRASTSVLDGARRLARNRAGRRVTSLWRDLKEHRSTRYERLLSRRRIHCPANADFADRRDRARSTTRFRVRVEARVGAGRIYLTTTVHGWGDRRTTHAQEEERQELEHDSHLAHAMNLTLARKCAARARTHPRTKWVDARSTLCTL